MNAVDMRRAFPEARHERGILIKYSHGTSVSGGVPLIKLVFRLPNKVINPHTKRMHHERAHVTLAFNSQTAFNIKRVVYVIRGEWPERFNTMMDADKPSTVRKLFHGCLGNSVQLDGVVMPYLAFGTNPVRQYVWTVVGTV